MDNTISYVDALILHAYKPLVDKCGITETDIDVFIDENSYLSGEDKVDRLIYYLIHKCRYQMRELWPLCDDELEPYFLKMGIALD